MPNVPRMEARSTGDKIEESLPAQPAHSTSSDPSRTFQGFFFGTETPALEQSSRDPYQPTASAEHASGLKLGSTPSSLKSAPHGISTPKRKVEQANDRYRVASKFDPPKTLPTAPSPSEPVSTLDVPRYNPQAVPPQALGLPQPAVDVKDKADSAADLVPSTMWGRPDPTAFQSVPSNLLHETAMQNTAQAEPNTHPPISLPETKLNPGVQPKLTANEPSASSPANPKVPNTPPEAMQERAPERAIDISFAFESPTARPLTSSGTPETAQREKPLIVRNSPPAKTPAMVVGPSAHSGSASAAERSLPGSAPRLEVHGGTEHPVSAIHSVEAPPHTPHTTEAVTDTVLSSLQNKNHNAGPHPAAEISKGVFRALDSGKTSVDPVWTHPSSNRTEATYQDPTLGWVRIRAQVNGTGVHAEIIPTSEAARRALSDQSSGLGSYLAEHQTRVDSWRLAPTEPILDFGNTRGTGEQGLAHGDHAQDGSGNSGEDQPQSRSPDRSAVVRHDKPVQPSQPGAMRTSQMGHSISLIA